MSALDSSLVLSLQPPDRRNLHEVVLHQLLEAIRLGQLKPGDRLREEQIAEHLSLSRGTVREAIRRLEQEGLVVTHPHRGTFIASLTVKEVSDIFALRRLLEGFAVRLAARRATERDLEALGETTKAMVAASEAGRRLERIQIDHHFHEQICALSDNAYLHRVWSSLKCKLWLVYFARNDRSTADLVSRARSHYDLIELLRRRDADGAVAWLEAHIQATEARGEWSPRDR